MKIKEANENIFPELKTNKATNIKKTKLSPTQRQL